MESLSITEDKFFMSNSESQPSGAKLQDKPQVTPANPPAKATAEVPIYTETQLQEKIKEAQSNIRKGEGERYKKLETEFLTLKADKLALESQVEDIEVLKEQIATLHDLKTENLPAEAKEYIKLIASQKENEVRGLKTLKPLMDRLGKYENSAKETLVNDLSVDTGLSKETLMKFSVEHLKEMQDTRATKTETKGDETKVAEPVAETKPVDKMPSVETGAIQAGGGQSDADFWKAYGQKGFAATPADHKRAKELYDKSIKGG
jgi:hypothetical protein